MTTLVKDPLYVMIQPRYSAAVTLVLTESREAVDPMAIIPQYHDVIPCENTRDLGRHVKNQMRTSTRRRNDGKLIWT